MVRLLTAPLCFMLVFLLSACHKEPPRGVLEQGQVALTFDDAYIDNWFDHLDLLDSLHITATFYITKYHTFSPKQKERLREVARRGHEIGYHSTNHADMAKEAARNGIAKTEAAEISPDLRLMRADGYAASNFAYPYGSHTAQLNTCLLRTFKSVRALSNQQNYYKSLVKNSGAPKVLYGANVDNNSRLTDEKLLSLMNDAQQNHDCLVLVAHEINRPGVKLQISRERLLRIARHAAENHLRFVRIDEVAR